MLVKLTLGRDQALPLALRVASTLMDEVVQSEPFQNCPGEVSSLCSRTLTLSTPESVSVAVPVTVAVVGEMSPTGEVISPEGGVVSGGMTSNSTCVSQRPAAGRSVLPALSSETASNRYRGSPFGITLPEGSRLFTVKFQFLTLGLLVALSCTVVSK